MLLAALLSGCGSTSGNESSAPNEVNSETTLQTAQKIHLQWRDTLINAEALRIYSPERYNTMMVSWQKADSLFKEIQQTPDMALQSASLFSSTTYIDRFYEDITVVENNHKELEYLKRVADEVLAPSITQIAYLNSVDASQHYRSEFVRLNRFYAKLFSLIARGQISDAKEEQNEFLSRAHSLEIRVIKRIYIMPQEEALRELRRNDVRYYAPLSYAKVEAEIAGGKALIDNSPRAFDAINQTVSAIKFELAHAEHIAQEVKSLRDRSRDEYESFFLEMEGQLLNISLALKDEDLRDVPLAQQAKLIEEAIIVARRQHDSTSKQLARSETNDQLDILQTLISQQNEQIALLKSQLKQLTEAKVAPPVTVPSAQALEPLPDVAAGGKGEVNSAEPTAPSEQQEQALAEALAQ
ncbi:hypothetical protein C9I98_03970 [Photobacterium sanctipauli]|uniref:ATPase n=1 Tax=Photobacterium sanctipauli TaxID=1342794 RepID=A0A2T3NXV3_9GAMM|nr:hypothetical protein [Photobacterium sanctipauli]PSW21115.1 hypothetical protein C9I98_03970 [Photobacterium sanctipauli]